MIRVTGWRDFPTRPDLRPKGFGGLFELRRKPMHMADALLSPAVGGALWAVTAATIACSSRKVKEHSDDRQTALMGVLAAFIFAAQMINFTIPGTGSSGHLGGGMILAILLGPWAGFLALASVLTVQALFFGDGGLLALGANILNLGMIPCFLAYPLIYQKIAGAKPSERRIFSGALLAAVVGLQLGAFGVVLATVASGISDLPFASFALLMQPIHLAIGLVEGVVTAAVVLLVWKARPEILQGPEAVRPGTGFSGKKALVGLLIATALTGGALSWFASSRPDGLEWAISGVTGRAEVESGSADWHFLLAGIQDQLTFWPGYDFSPAADPGQPPAGAEKSVEAWPAVKSGTTFAGLVGGMITLGLVAGIGLLLKRRVRPGAA
jgi:cobalt/nickel transport system permease protein